MTFLQYAGYPLVALVSISGIRMLLYFRSFFFSWARFRQLKVHTTEDIKALAHVPFVKIQITTRGTSGTTEVIKRGIRNIEELCAEDLAFYCQKLSVEVITECEDQRALSQECAHSPVDVDVITLPDDYETPNGTMMKARALHYMVELRRGGFNRKPGETYIIHYDEESVMEPVELRNLIYYVSTTDKRLSEGPIVYPLEFTEASAICRSMECTRPLGCYECRGVMETGVPLHLHGSNLVVQEELENELGWDIGNLDGQPFIAEDYIFGVLAYLKAGPEVFGWHGALMLEQPPFSFKSAFKQRLRWILGVLQGINMLHRMREFYELPRRVRLHLVWGTRFRIMTLALGVPTGVLGTMYLALQAWLVLSGQDYLPLPTPLMIWMACVGYLWFNMLFIGAFYNLYYAHQLSPAERIVEAGRALTIAPVSSVMESSAGLWAVMRWAAGYRRVAWAPTPKTRQADDAVGRGSRR